MLVYYFAKDGNRARPLSDCGSTTEDCSASRVPKWSSTLTLRTLYFTLYLNVTAGDSYSLARTSVALAPAD